ncbi:MAG: hypothetical protein GX096_11245 [Clostridiales bacterium]|nr:hypothetical protein [Clostridiales bacterium]
METSFRISVRDLVAFTYFQEDILPSGDASLMLAGTQAHKSRQEQTDDHTEYTVKSIFEEMGETMLVFGRIDIFRDGDIPVIEEIKLSSWNQPYAMPEHRAQALCYAAMIAKEKPAERVTFSVCYVNAGGEVEREFTETLTSSELMDEMHELLMPWLKVAIREQAHQKRRDASLKSMTFPFEGYRKGQRELAVQVYTAITRKKRLYASLPTGTGKSAAVLFPALKAMGEGKNKKILYFTARNTARQSPLATLEKMQAKGMIARCSTLTAKEKMCPKMVRCHPDYCERAKGHYSREIDAIDDLIGSDNLYWDDALITQVANKHNICPFEFALALTDLADVVVLDINYAFDPFAQLKRMFQRKRGLTLLIDEAHHTVDRVRESLSGEMDSKELVRHRAIFGKEAGRRHSFYKELTKVINQLRLLMDGDDPSTESLEIRLDDLPDGIVQSVQELLDECMTVFANPVHSGEAMASVSAVIRLCLPFLYAVEHLDDDYAILLSGKRRERCLTLYCLLPSKEIARITKTMQGTVFFSATLTPLPAMKQLLGGEEGDACFSFPSPFPPQNLKVVRKRISTRYQDREQSAKEVAGSISQAVMGRKGKYIAYFPSYAYMRLVLSDLNQEILPPLWIQDRDMDEENRNEFLRAFQEDQEAKLGLCVLGGLFSEGVDLPGDQLIGAIIVGVGLPVPTQRVKVVQTCYAHHFGDGFGYACRIPGMHKVLQAGGRVIRTEEDMGLVLLLDDRYYHREYEALLPQHWQLINEDIGRAIAELEG